MANAATYNFSKLHFAEGAAPATPDAGEVVIYAKADGSIYQKDDAGTETALGGSIGTQTSITFSESAAPATPSTGEAVIYVKTDGKLYLKDDAGTETDLTASGGGGGEAVTPTPDASDEFDDASWGGTTVDPASPTTTVLEQNGRLSVAHPGGDAAAELHGYMIPFSPAGDFCVMSRFKIMSPNGFSGNQFAGVIAADGTTHGAGNQMIAHLETVNGRYDLRRMTNYTTQAAGTNGDSYASTLAFYNKQWALALQYTSSSNQWKMYYGPDGETWFAGVTAIELTSSAITTSHVGLMMTTWGGSRGMAGSFEYIRAYNGTLAANGFNVI